MPQTGKQKRVVYLTKTMTKPKPKTFSPTEIQEAFVSKMRANGYNISYDTAAIGIGTTEATIYNWFKKPAFAEWFQGEAARHFAMKMPRVWAALYDSAISATGPTDSKYNPAAQKLALDRFDKDFVPKSKTEIDTPSPLVLAIEIAEKPESLGG